MQKSKINIDPNTLDAIARSTKLSTTEKIDFLKYVSYMTVSEKRELISLI
jgi:hypothetical protein